MFCCKDGCVGPKTRMWMALGNDMIPDKLDPIEIDALAELVEDGMAGDGWKREQKLGRWYDIIQAVINDRTYVRKRR